MLQASEKEIVDVTDIQARHTAASKQVYALFIGFHALSADFSYHLENTYGGHKIDIWEKRVTISMLRHSLRYYTN